MYICICNNVFVSNERQNGPTFCVGPHMPQVNIWMIKIKKFASKKIRLSLNFENPRICSLNPQTSSVINLQRLQR